MSNKRKNKNKNKKKEDFSHDLNVAFSETAEEIDEMLEDTGIAEDVSENPDIFEDPEIFKIKTTRKKIIFGAVLIFFSLLGIISGIRFAVDVTKKIIERQDLKDEFALFVYPLVITDIPAFNDVSSLQSTTVIPVAVWRIILSENTLSYSRDNGMMTIPATDVEASAHAIFGDPGFKIEHQTIDNIDIIFEYNAEINSYIVPENPRYISYVPRIEKISNNGSLYSITVDYMSPSPMSLIGFETETGTEAGTGRENKPIKSMVYKITRTNNSKKINSSEIIAKNN